MRDDRRYTIPPEFRILGPLDATFIQMRIGSQIRNGMDRPNWEVSSSESGYDLISRPAQEPIRDKDLDRIAVLRP